MRSKVFFLIFSVFSFMLFGNSHAASSDEEGVFHDESTGDYLVQYKGSDGSVVAGKFYPSTKVDPYIKSTYKRLDDGRVSYRLKLKNGSSGRQDVEMILVRISGGVGIYDQDSSVGWEPALVEIPGGWKNLSWSSLSQGGRGEPLSVGLPPGSGYADFVFSSSYLPGISIAKVMGKPSGISGYPDEGPTRESDVGKKVGDLQRNDYVPRHVAAPMFKVPEPFSASYLLSSIRGHVSDEIVPSGLISTAIASQVDRILQEAVSASAAGNIASLEASLREIRKIMRRAYPGVDSDDAGAPEVGAENRNRQLELLVARVLIFDIGYIEDRIRLTGMSVQ